MASAAAGKKRDPLLDVVTECNRLVYFLKTTTLTENVKTNGVSAVDMAAMQQSIDAIKKAYDVSAQLSAAHVYSAEFLPPKAQRLVPTAGRCS
jgi:NitT/TauT family transport system substrate-binding protein